MFKHISNPRPQIGSKQIRYLWPALLGILLSTTIALSTQAGTGDSIEIQFSTGAFGGLLRQQFIGEQMCPEEIEWQGQDCIIDHIDYDPGHFDISLSAVDVPVNDELTIEGISAVRYIQPITAYIKTIECLEDADCPQHHYLDNQTVQVILSLRARVHEGAPQVCIAYDGVFPPMPWLQNMMEAELQGALGPDMRTCVGIPTGSLTGFIGSSYEPFGAGIALNEDQNRLGIRLQFRTPHSNPFPWQEEAQAQQDHQEWFDYLTGSIGPAPSDEEWSVLIGSSLLTSGIRGNLVDGINSSSDITIDYGDGGADAWWTGQGAGSGRIDADIYAEVEAGCWLTTIGVDPISFDMPMHLSQSKESIVIDGYVDWDVNDADIFACSLAHAAFGDFLSYTVLATALGIFAENFEPNMPTNLGGGCKVVDAHHFNCDIPFEMPTIDLAPGFSPASQLRVSGMTGYAEGLSLHGWMNPLGWQFQQDADIIYHPQLYGLSGGCSSMRVGWIDAELEVKNASLCDSYERPDEDNPGHMLLTVLTTRGSRTIRWQLPEEPTEAEKMGLKFKMMLAQINCMAPQTGLFGIAGKYNPRWDIDPPYFTDIFHTLDSRTDEIGRAAATLQSIQVYEGPSLSRTGKLSEDSVVMILEAALVVDKGGRAALTEKFSMEITLGMLKEHAQHKSGVSVTMFALETAIHQHDGLAFDARSLGKSSFTR